MELFLRSCKEEYCMGQIVHIFILFSLKSRFVHIFAYKPIFCSKIFVLDIPRNQFPINKHLMKWKIRGKENENGRKQTSIRWPIKMSNRALQREKRDVCLFFLRNLLIRKDLSGDICATVSFGGTNEQCLNNSYKKYILY